MVIVLVFTSCHKFRLTLFFCLWCVRFSLIFFRKILWGTQTFIIVSRQTAEIFAVYSKELFQCHIISQHYIFCLYQLIFKKHLQFLHIKNIQFFCFSEITVMFRPTTVWIKPHHFLYSMTACSYFCFSIYSYIGFSQNYFPLHFIVTRNHLSFDQYIPFFSYSSFDN